LFGGFADDRDPVAQEPLTLRRPPFLPNATEGDGVAIDARDSERRLATWIVAPLVIDPSRARQRRRATASMNLPDSAMLSYIRPGIDRLARLLEVLREVGDQTPFQRVEMALPLTR
jgi:hypothetical protein